jgi:hypothetical protein
MRVRWWEKQECRKSLHATETPFNIGSHRGKEDAVQRYWNKIGRPVTRCLESLPDRARQLQYGGRPITYSPGIAVMIILVALILRMTICEAYTFVQESERLRKALGIAPPSEETLEKIARARKQHHPDKPEIVSRHVADAAPEPGIFPTRQWVEGLVPWIDKWAGVYTAIDPVTGEVRTLRSTDESVGSLEGVIVHKLMLEAIERLTYVEIPVEIAQEFGLEFGVVAIDGHRIMSPRRHNKRLKRPDVGAKRLGKGDEIPMLGRRKMTAILVDLPVVVASNITTNDERVHFEEQFIGLIASRSDEIKRHAAERGMVGFRAMDDALVVSDCFYDTDGCKRKALDYGFDLAPRKRRSLTRKVIGVRKLAEDVIVDQCDDGTFLCPCDAYEGGRKKHPHKRQPMTQEAGRRAEHGGVYIRCTRPTCHLDGQRFWVPFREPDKVFKDGHHEPGKRSFTHMSTVWRGRKDVELWIHKGTQAVENHHSGLLAKFALGVKTRDGRRSIRGDARHSFYYLLADLIWNLTILFNLKDALVARDGVDPDELWDALVRLRHKIAKNSDAAAATSESMPAEADITPETTKGKKHKRKTGPPSIAVYVWPRVTGFRA